MKKIILFFFKKLYRINILRSLLASVVTKIHDIYIYFLSYRHPHDPKLVELKNKLEDSATVLNGPFKGMKYLGIADVGNAVYRKILGSYEKEIQSVIEDLLTNNNYSEIINVGCAEGYYAVGMALRCKKSNVYAYDTLEMAQHLSTKLAKMNAVSERVIVKSTLTSEELKNFNFTGKVLIFCDCEGYEKTLFNKSNIANLKNVDILIETHDYRDIEISSYLKELFNSTHDIDSIYSVDDIQKALHYDYTELNCLTLQSKLAILGEGRSSIMEWLVCKSKL